MKVLILGNGGFFWMGVIGSVVFKYFYMYLRSMYIFFMVGKNKYYFKYNVIEVGGLN